MSATGLAVIDKSLQTTNLWLDDVMKVTGPDRHVAWHVMGAILRALRDRLPLGLAAHLGAQLPLLIRGLYYDQWEPAKQALKERSRDEFLEHVSQGLAGTRPVNVEKATGAVFHAIDHYVEPGQVAKVREALPAPVRELWAPESVS